MFVIDMYKYSYVEIVVYTLHNVEKCLQAQWLVTEERANGSMTLHLSRTG